MCICMCRREGYRREMRERGENRDGEGREMEEGMREIVCVYLYV